MKNQNKIHTLPCVIALLFALFKLAQCESNLDGEPQLICSKPGFELNLLTHQSNIVAIAGQNQNEPRTVFLLESPELIFECSVNSKTTPDITIEPRYLTLRKSLKQAKIQGILESSTLKFPNPINSDPISASCPNPIVGCQSIVILMRNVSISCDIQDNVFCETRRIWKEVFPEQLNPDYFSYDTNAFISYSIFDPSTSGWIFCDELDKSGSTMKKGVHMDKDTESIRCPSEVPVDDRPLLLRVERTEKSKVGLGLTFLPVKDKITYSYIGITQNDDQIPDPDDDEEQTSNCSNLTQEFIAIPTRNLITLIYWLTIVIITG